MNTIRIAIDPELSRTHGPEVHWTWRLLLTSIGWAWEEVPLDAPCDIAYVSNPADAPQAKLRIQADISAWQAPHTARLAEVGRVDGLAYPRYAGQAAQIELARAESGPIFCPRDLIFDVFWLATGQEERYQRKDRFGFYDLRGTASLESGLFRQALGSHIRLWLERIVRRLGGPPPVPRWPDGKRAAASSGHDVDYPEVVRWLEPLRIVSRRGLSSVGTAVDVLIGRCHHWNFSNWVALERTLGLRSTFYFVPRQGSLVEYALSTPDPFYDITAPRFRELFRYLRDEGWEIQMHASYEAYRDPARLVAEKQRLESASGHEIVGNRHHYWHLNPDDAEETLFFHEQAGFTYDQSLVHNRYLGWRRGLAEPFFPFYQKARRELKTLQVPIAWMDDQLFRMRNHNPGDRRELLRELVDRVAEQSGVFNTDVHEYVYDETLYPGWREIYCYVWEYVRQRGDFWVTTASEITAHWTAQYFGMVQASQGLKLGML